MNARRTRGLLAALALTVGLTAGCTVGDWKYESAPAAGVQQDVNGVKARNLMAITDGTSSVLLGTLLSYEDTTLDKLTLAPEKEDGGGYSDPVDVNITKDLKGNVPLKLDASNARLETALEPGLTARVTLTVAGQSQEMDIPVYSTEHPDFKDVL